MHGICCTGPGNDGLPTLLCGWPERHRGLWLFV